MDPNEGQLPNRTTVLPLHLFVFDALLQFTENKVRDPTLAPEIVEMLWEQIRLLQLLLAVGVQPWTPENGELAGEIAAAFRQLQRETDALQHNN
ncbi:unnamed protein product [Caenorhabditis brenneri]